MERTMGFYEKIFGENFWFGGDDYNKDSVKIINVNNMNSYNKQILDHGGSLTVPEIVLTDKQKIAYYSDPNGNIFALLEEN